MGRFRRDTIARRIMREAAGGAYPDPDAVYQATDAFAFEMPAGVRPLAAELALADIEPFGSHHPVPLLLRLHAEGRGPRDLAAAIVLVARIGLREWLADPERDEGDDWGAERRETVARHLDRYRDRDCAYDEELVAALTEAEYMWFSFDDDAGAAVAGVRDVRTLDRIEDLGGHLGHVARAIAEIQGVPRPGPALQDRPGGRPVRGH